MHYNYNDLTRACSEPAVAQEHRNGRKRVIIRLLSQICNSDGTKSAFTASSLRNFYDTLKNRTGALEALGRNTMSQ